MASGEVYDFEFQPETAGEIPVEVSNVFGEAKLTDKSWCSKSGSQDIGTSAVGRGNRFSDNACSLRKLRFRCLVCGPRKQQQIPIRILDDESLGAPGLPLQRLAKIDARGLKLKKQQLDLIRRGDSYRCRQQFLATARRRFDHGPLDRPEIETRPVATYLRIEGRAAVTEYE